jgi:N-acetylglucosaminyldiphosphoundecaprenol N-acetyl-beta-D-mannosaminyltransferase
VVAYAFGHPFWNVRIGPLPITLDRVVLVGLVGTLAVQWRIGRVRIRPLTAADWALLAMLFVVGASAVASGQPEFSDGVTSKWGRLVTSFLIPATLFFVARQIHITRRESSWLLVGFVLFGVYLGVTALFEIAGAWSLVFPRYIANPALGIHFGRARGPDLNSVSLGLYLTACIWCAWTLLGEEAKRWQQLAVLVTLPLMAAGVFFTYTRSTWLGLAASALVIGAIGIPRRWRLPALATSALVGMLVVAASWTQLTGLEREGSAAESSHSVDQRTSFAYVSWQMFRDNPVFGVGFGRFYDRKLPYLSDRSQDFELESIRPLHHHNTLLSLLTETGLIGLAAFVAMLGIWVRSAWRLIQNGESPRWVRSFGVLMLALAVNYFCSALFHDLTLLPSQHLLLFAFAGFMVNLHQQASSQLIEGWHALRLREGREVENIATPFEDSEPATRVELFGMQIDCVTMPDAVNRVLDWCYEPRQNTCRYIVTPNVNHAVLFERRADLRAAYADASLVLADGAPIVVASRLLNRALPERVAGSDLVPRLFDMADRPLKVFLLGAEPGIAQAASKRIERQSHKVEVVGAYSPPIGFENNKLENARIIALIAAAAPDLVVVGLGAPKQELWVHRHRHQLQAKVVVCAGATIDFLAGHRRRSPVWMRRTGLEWLHRVCTEPRRLASRYARDAWIFPQLVWREWRRANV